MSSIKIAVVMVVIIGAVAACTPTDAGNGLEGMSVNNVSTLPEATSSSLLFVSNEDGDREIYRMFTDENTVQQLTHNDRDDYDAHWSPDGNQILFTSSRDGGNAEIYLMNADGTEQNNLSNHPGFDGGGNWAPDGQSIVFSSDRSGSIELHHFILASGKISQLTDTGEDSALNGRWSPDGQWVAYSQFDRNGKADTWSVHVGTGQTRQITNNPKHEDGPVAWSPKGDRLLYHSRRNKEFNIYAYVLESGEEHQLTELPSNDVDPVWSANGSQIAFLSTRGQYGRTQLCLMKPDGTGQRCVTDGRYQTRDPAWLPDGKGLLFTSWQHKRVSNLYSLDQSTMELRHLAPSSSYQSQPLPRPAGMTQ